MMMPVMTDLDMNYSFIILDTFWAFIFVALIILRFPECYKLLMEHTKIKFRCIVVGVICLSLFRCNTSTLTSFAAQIYFRYKLFWPPMTNAIDVHTFACNCIIIGIPIPLRMLRISKDLSMENNPPHMTTALSYIFGGFCMTMWWRYTQRERQLYVSQQITHLNIINIWPSFDKIWVNLRMYIVHV